MENQTNQLQEENDFVLDMFTANVEEPELVLEAGDGTEEVAEQALAYAVPFRVKRPE